MEKQNFSALSRVARFKCGLIYFLASLSMANMVQDSNDKTSQMCSFSHPCSSLNHCGSALWLPQQLPDASVEEASSSSSELSRLYFALVRRSGSHHHFLSSSQSEAALVRLPELEKAFFSVSTKEEENAIASSSFSAVCSPS